MPLREAKFSTERFESDISLVSNELSKAIRFESHLVDVIQKGGLEYEDTYKIRVKEPKVLFDVLSKAREKTKHLCARRSYMMMVKTTFLTGDYSNISLKQKEVEGIMRNGLKPIDEKAIMKLSKKTLQEIRDVEVLAWEKMLNAVKDDPSSPYKSQSERNIDFLNSDANRNAHKTVPVFGSASARIVVDACGAAEIAAPVKAAIDGFFDGLSGLSRAVHDATGGGGGGGGRETSRLAANPAASLVARATTWTARVAPVVVKKRFDLPNKTFSYRVCCMVAKELLPETDNYSILLALHKLANKERSPKTLTCKQLWRFLEQNSATATPEEVKGLLLKKQGRYESAAVER